MWLGFLMILLVIIGVVSFMVQSVSIYGFGMEAKRIIEERLLAIVEIVVAIVILVCIGWTLYDDLEEISALFYILQNVNGDTNTRASLRCYLPTRQTSPCTEADSRCGEEQNSLGARSV